MSQENQPPPDSEPAVDPERAALEAEYGQVWNTEELQRDFEVVAFMAPFISAKRKSDGQLGTLLFQHSPRFYCRFEPYDEFRK